MSSRFISLGSDGQLPFDLFCTVKHSEGLAVGMEDVDVGDDADANGDMVEKDDAELCYEKHTGIIKNNNILCCASKYCIL